MPRRDLSSRLHSQREIARREAKAARRARATEPDASPTIYCTDPAAHERFHRLLRGSAPVCGVCGPKAADE
jgi:hypothetical protein